ncbi:hypothetical protein D918_00467 [Trichuris suis]|nr:hypothetical protein D918_00467 [Trichuris suis]
MVLNTTYTIFLLLLGGTAVLSHYNAWQRLEDLQHANKDKNATACDEISRSILKHTDVQHRWIIEHFHEQEALQKLTSMQIQSAEFSSPDKRYRFRISLQSSEGTTGYSSAHTPQRAQRTLTVHSLGDSGSLSCKVRFDIAYAYGTLQNLSEKVIHLKKTRAVAEIAVVALPQQLDLYIDNDALTILCAVTVYEQASTVCDSASPTDKENGKAFVDSFEKFLKAKTGTDMDVMASDCVITAHKSIFLARSPVMITLIEQNKERYLLNATQYSCQAMQCVVSYVYTDKCTIKSETAEAVLQAAHDYQMPRLERIAENELVRCLDEKNIASRIKLTKDIGSTVLARGLSNYIIRNRHVLNSDAWKKMETENPSPTAFILKETILHM